MFKNSILLLFFIILKCQWLLGQQLKFSPFDGTVYKMMSARKYWKFNESYKDFPIINTFSWDKIDVPSRDIEDGFPDVERTGSFGIMFEAKMEVTQTAMYRFEINSDDGTILWIDGKEVINNDTQGAMHAKADTIALAQGVHDVKLWYFQAYPTQYGVIFNAEHVDVPIKFDVSELTFKGDILFSTNSSKIKKSGFLALDTFANKLSNFRDLRLVVEGHSDNIGLEEFNLKLSLKRAEAIRDYLIKKVSGKGFSFITQGKGEAFPIANNETEEGRAKNRRVVIKIESNDVNEY